MKLDHKQNAFLLSREKRLRIWPWLGFAMILGIVLLLSYLYFTTPLLVNPVEVIDKIETAEIRYTTLTMMASMLPIMVLIIFSLVFIIVLFGYAVASNEKKYMGIISELKDYLNQR